MVGKNCKTCKEYLTIDRFSPCKSSKDKLQYSCKICRNKCAHFSKNTIIHCMPTHKICSSCGIDKEANDFCVEKRVISGLTSKCRDCENDRKLIDSVKTRELEKMSSSSKYFSDTELILIAKLFEQKYGSRKIAEKLNTTRAKIKEAYRVLGLSTDHVKAPNIRVDHFRTHKLCKGCFENKDVIEFKYKLDNEYKQYSARCIVCDKKNTNSRASKRYSEDVCFALHKRITKSIGKRIVKNGVSCIPFLPFTIDDLKKHIEGLFEPWMTWENRGNYKISEWNDDDQSTWKWQIDHIIPHSTFNYISMEDQQFRECWSLSNLRPLSAKQNIIDGASKIRHNAI